MENLLIANWMILDLYKESKDLGYFSSNRKGLWGSKSDEVYKVVKEGNVNITGIVFDKNTKKPIANAHVKLIDENGQIICRTICRNRCCIQI